MNRAQRRKMARENRRSIETVEGQMEMFERLPDHCLACEKPFDKRNKSAAMTWNVVVRNNTKEVNLYCPECWKMAINFIKEIKDEKE